MVLAGAGSGKTRVITARLARLLREGIDPRAIVALTFTNKAAAEMRERAGISARTRRAVPTVCTFHAFGLQLVRRYAAELGFRAGSAATPGNRVRSAGQHAAPARGGRRPAPGRRPRGGGSGPAATPGIGAAHGHRRQPPGSRNRERATARTGGRLPAPAAPAPGGGFRRPDPAAAGAAARRGRRRHPDALQPRDGGRVPGHFAAPVPDPARTYHGDAQRLRGGRRRSVDLLLARRGGGELRPLQP